MEFATTLGIKVSVETLFRPEYSSYDLNEFFFSYFITIFNQSDYSVKLLSRHWHILDSNGQQKEVIGDGVIGIQPIIAPNQKHQYDSGCNLRSDFGFMWGTYTMIRLIDNQQFEVLIPKFKLEVPYRNN